jgi:hypothetical protein
MTREAATRRANATLQELVNLCAPEIAEALNEFKASNNVLISDVTMFTREVAMIGVRKAAQTLRDEPGRSLLEYVKDCVADVLREAEVDQREQLRSLAPEQILDIVMRLPRQQRPSCSTSSPSPNATI